MKKEEKDLVGLLIYMFLMLCVCFFVVIRRLKLPSYGDDILRLKIFYSVLQILAGIAIIPIRFVNVKIEEDILRGFIKVIFPMIGLLVCIYSLHEINIFRKDYHEDPKTYFFETCTGVKKAGKYYLKATDKETEYIFDITGADSNTIIALNEKPFGVKVTAYPNSNLVVAFEVYNDLKNYALNIPLDVLKQYKKIPSDKNLHQDAVMLLAEDIEHDVALYGLNKKGRYGALIRVGDEVLFSSLFWNENNNKCLPEIAYSDIDSDGESEILIQCFEDAEYKEKNIDLIVKKGRLYVGDFLDDKWEFYSFTSNDYLDALYDRMILWFSKEGHIWLELDGEEVDSIDVPQNERNAYYYQGHFNKTGAARFDLKNMTLIVKPFHYYKEMNDFVDIEFRWKYKNGEFYILEGNVIVE